LLLEQPQVELAALFLCPWVREALELVALFLLLLAIRAQLPVEL
jgi:hypothetical protein